MAALTLTLADGTILTGKSHLRLNPAFELSSSASMPLLVLVHGGAQTADFFDIDSKHTVRHLSELLGVPAIAINRPGYGGTPVLSGSYDTGSDTFIQRHGRWLNDLALPAIWKEFSRGLNVSSIVLYGESIGGAVSTVAAGLHEDEPSTYKLAGLVLSAVGSDPNTEPLTPLFGDGKAGAKPLEVPLELSHWLAVGDKDLYDPDVLKNHYQEDSSAAELHDINVVWPTYWRSYAERVTVQVLYTQGALDNLWHTNAETVYGFGQAFKNSFWVETRMSQNAPHCIELSYQSSGYLLRVFGFALECAVALKIKEGRDKRE